MELAIYGVFRDAGIEEAQAKAIATTFNTSINETVTRAIEQHYAVHSQQLATKGDTEQLRLEIEKVRADIEKVRLETKAEIEKSKADIIKWNIGAIIAAAGLAMAIARLFLSAG